MHQVLDALIDNLIVALPQRLKAVYLLGSYAEGNPTNQLSDLDVLAIFSGALSEAEQQLTKQVVAQQAASAPVRLDVMCTGERELEQLDAVFRRSWRNGGQLRYGEDIRPRLPDISLEAYRRSAWWGVHHFVGSVLRDGQPITLPLDYPEPAGEFFGYDRVRRPAWYPPGWAQGTKELVATVSRLCGAILAETAGLQAAGKTEAMRWYIQVIHDDRSDVVRGVLEKCKLEWQYQIPAAASDRSRLRDLCVGVLELENAALGLYAATPRG